MLQTVHCILNIILPQYFVKLSHELQTTLCSCITSARVNLITGLTSSLQCCETSAACILHKVDDAPHLCRIALLTYDWSCSAFPITDDYFRIYPVFWQNHFMIPSRFWCNLVFSLYLAKYSFQLDQNLCTVYEVNMAFQIEFFVQ